MYKITSITITDAILTGTNVPEAIDALTAEVAKGNVLIRTDTQKIANKVDKWDHMGMPATTTK
jgi:hypothetical protein